MTVLAAVVATAVAATVAVASASPDVWDSGSVGSSFEPVGHQDFGSGDPDSTTGDLGSGSDNQDSESGELGFDFAALSSGPEGQGFGSDDPDCLLVPGSATAGPNCGSVVRDLGPDDPDSEGARSALGSDDPSPVFAET